MSKNKRILLIGAGDNGKTMATFFEQSKKHEFVGFVDDTKNPGELILGKPVFGGIEEIYNFYQNKVFEEVMIAIGYKHLDFKKDLFSKLESKNIPIASFVHETALVNENVEIAPGSFISPGVILDAGVKIGKGVFMNPGCVVAHDTIVGDFCFFAPAIQIAGFVDLCERSFLGINTTIINNIKIKEPIQTGASSTIVKDIDCSGLYLGTPAKLKEKGLV